MSDRRRQTRKQLAPIIFAVVMIPLTIWAVDRLALTGSDQTDVVEVWRPDATRLAQLAALRAQGDIGAIRAEAAEGDPAALTALAAMLCAAGAEDEAAEHLSVAASQDYPPAMIAITALSAPRTAALADPRNAGRLWDDLPDLEQTTTTELAESFIAGPCIPEANRDRARWFIALLRTGTPDGLLMLAAAYESGDGVARDPIEAYALIEAFERYHRSWPPPPQSETAETIARLEAELTRQQQAEAGHRADAWIAILAL